MAINQWMVTTDSQSDATQLGSQGVTVGPIFDYRGIAYIETETEIIYAFSSNVALSGYQSNSATDGIIGHTPLLLNFDPSATIGESTELLAIRFGTQYNPSSIGLYQNFDLVNVTGQNRSNGKNIVRSQYENDVNKSDGTVSYGEMSSAEAAAVLGPANQSVDNEVIGGEKVGEIRYLSDAELTEAQGLFQQANVAANHTFGFAISKDLLPTGDFVAVQTLECGNDFIIMPGTIEIPPELAVEKRINGLEADTPEAAATLLSGQQVIYTVEVSNTGEVAVEIADLVVDDPKAQLFLIPGSDAGGDGILSPGETLIYSALPQAQQSDRHVIDFEFDSSGQPLTKGTWIENQYADIGLRITSRSGSEFGTMLFDSENPTPGDFDLGTVNQGFGGPGIGEGGGRGMPGENSVPQGQVLIISEDGDTENPDDYYKGGTFIFEFDSPVVLEQLDLLDRGQDSLIQFFDQTGTLVGGFETPALGENSFQVVDLNNVVASKLEVTFPDSGAIANLVFSEFIENTVTVSSISHPEVSVSDSAYYIGSDAAPQPMPSVCVNQTHCICDCPDLITEQNPILPTPAQI